MLRPVAPELMHVTLAFLGEVGEHEVPRTVEAVHVAAIGSGPFDVGITGIGRFPEHGAPRALWVGVDAPAAAAIVRIGASVRAELLRHGLRFDPKPLRAHVTLARVRDGADPGEARAAVTAARVPEVRFRAETLHVMESTLGRGGPRYASRAAIPLVAPAG